MGDSVTFPLRPKKPVAAGAVVAALEIAKDTERKVRAKKNKGIDVRRQRSIDSENVTNAPKTAQYTVASADLWVGTKRVQEHLPLAS